MVSGIVCGEEVDGWLVGCEYVGDFEDGRDGEVRKIWEGVG